MFSTFGILLLRPSKGIDATGVPKTAPPKLELRGVLLWCERAKVDLTDWTSAIRELELSNLHIEAQNSFVQEGVRFMSAVVSGSRDDLVAHLVKTRDLSPHALVVEFSESANVSEMIAQVSDALVEAGVSVSSGESHGGRLEFTIYLPATDTVPRVVEALSKICPNLRFS